MHKPTGVAVLRLLAMAAVVLAASSLFALRGPFRAMHKGGADFAAPYVSSARFAHGLNPYSHTDFLDSWHAMGAHIDADIDASGQRPVYPPSTLILMLLFSLATWSKALSIYVIVCTISYGYMLFLFATLIDDKRNSWQRIGFLAYGFAMAPVHTGIGVGNLSILAFILCMYCLLLAYHKKNVASGLLLALAFCMKPTVAIPVIIYLLFCRRWRLLSVGFVFTSLITACAMLRMSQIPSIWVDDYRENISYLFGPNGAANFASDDTLRFDLLNLQMPLFQLLHSTSYANLFSWLIVGLLGTVWILLFMRHRNVERRWEAAGVLLLLGLLPIYQRNYNAGFVLVALLWAFQNYSLPAAKWIMAIGTIFLVPGEAALRTFSSHLSQQLTSSLLWNFGIMPQATWGILLITLILLLAMANSPKSASS